MHKIILVIVGCLLLLSNGITAQSIGQGPFTLDAPSGATNIQWYKDGAMISGATNATYSAATEGTYWASYDDATGCSISAGRISVIELEDDNVQTTFSAPAGATNIIWSKDDTPINGETNATLEVNNSQSSVGTYVLSHDINACTITSNLMDLYIMEAPCSDPDLYADNCDFDGDGVSNEDDLDDDNDGILDTEECSNIQDYDTYAQGATQLTGTFANGVGLTVNMTNGTGTLSSYTTNGANQSGTADYFSNSDYYTTPVTNTDAPLVAIAGGIGSTGSMSFDFSRPVTDPKFHFNNIDYTEWDFASTQHSDGSAITAADIQLLSANSRLEVNGTVMSNNNVIDGSGEGTLVNPSPSSIGGYGTVQFYGTYSSIKVDFTKVANTLDGFTFYMFLDGTCDDDNDGIANHLDLDSDGDGCYDRYEAGIANTTTDGSSTDSLVIVSGTAGDVGDNGFSDALETVAESGLYDGTYTYSDATDDQIATCPVPCDAGTSAPTLSASTLMNVCDDPQANLTTITASNMPTGTITLEWHTSSTVTDATTLYGSPTVAVAGTYYAVFHDTANDCYSPVSAELIVTLIECCAAPSTAPNIVLPNGSN